MKMKKVCKILIYLIVIVCVLLGAIKGVFWYIEEQERKLREAELTELSQTQYDGFFCSMYPAEGFKTEDFETYVGGTTFVSRVKFEKLEDISEYLDVAITNNLEMTNVFLGIDPYSISQEEIEGEIKWDDILQNNLLVYIEEYEEVTFQIMLPYPSLDYWITLEDDEIRDRLDSYERFIEELTVYENVICYYLGAEEWLITNPKNYVDDYEINDVVSLKTMLYTFCDKKFQVTMDNATDLIKSLSKTIMQEKKSPTIYPDLSEWQVVFFGDSVVANYPGSISIPGVVNGLSNAETYNYGIGGTSASDKDSIEGSFNDVVANFLEGTSNVTWGNKNYTEKSDKRLCFVIHYGLNDYFENRPIESVDNLYDTSTYTGAMRKGISSLKENYPNATIIVIAPHPAYVVLEHDTPQSDYIEALEAVAQELSVIYVNNFDELGWNVENYTSYLEDRCHPNVVGRMIIGKRIIEVLAEQ